jgi:hypothetical protein
MSGRSTGTDAEGERVERVLDTVGGRMEDLSINVLQ